MSSSATPSSSSAEVVDSSPLRGRDEGARIEEEQGIITFPVVYNNGNPDVRTVRHLHQSHSISVPN